jgi:ligand-binding sensor protein
MTWDNRGQLCCTDLVDMQKVQALLVSLYRVVGIANTLIGADGKVIAQAGLREGCEQLERIDPEPCRRCVERNRAKGGGLPQGLSHAVHQCRKGLIEIAVPILIDGELVASVHFGRFLSHPLDFEFFRKEAGKAQIEEFEYLAAIAKIPAISSAQREALKELYLQLGSVLTELWTARARACSGRRRSSGPSLPTTASLP